MFLFWGLGFGKEKHNPKHCSEECDFKYELCSHPENRLWSERWCHPNSRVVTLASFPSPVFSKVMVHGMWLDGSSQLFFHIAHFTSCQAHSNQNISPTQCSVLNSPLLKIAHGLIWFKGVHPHIKKSCPWFLALVTGGISDILRSLEVTSRWLRWNLSYWHIDLALKK